MLGTAVPVWGWVLIGVACALLLGVCIYCLKRRAARHVDDGSPFHPLAAIDRADRA